MSAGHSSQTQPSQYAGLPVYRLVDVLKFVPLPPNCPLSGVSSKWRCVLAPKIASSNSSNDKEAESALRFFEAGIPCRLSRERSAAVHAACGEDAFSFVHDPRWNKFPKPKIAFRAGWAGPGTQMESEAYHKLIGSFKDVVDHVEAVKMPPSVTTSSDATPVVDDSAVAPADALDDVQPQDILNLQMFHRSDPNIDPLIPVLSEKLEWLDALQEGAVCDNATRVSQRGAVTWWHLDDSGEFVMQTGLPLKPRPEHFFSPHVPQTPEEATIMSTLYCSDESPSGQVPTKLFVYGPPNSYDWFSHDDEGDVSARIAALDIFHCPDDELPDDGSLLPILCVAVLESAGRPLISPPNIPHAVFSLNNCVMVEQRRVCNLFLEEVAHFLQKCKKWQNHPIVYQYVEEQLQNEAVVREEIIPTLNALFHSHDDEQHRDLDLLMRKRVAASLYTIFTFPEYFKLPEDARKSLGLLIDDKMAAYLNARQEGDVAPWTLKRRLDDHWEVKDKYWPKPGCVFAPPRNAGSVASTNPAAATYLPVVYRLGHPVYGSKKSTVAETAAEYHHMARLRDVDKASKWTTAALAKYLATAKHPAPKDDLLDELF
jgi:hypothetical protein